MMGRIGALLPTHDTGDLILHHLFSMPENRPESKKAGTNRFLND
ncbi:hypothetical protein [Neglectibacter sp. 59]|jgi:hypothetical protein|nr:hypothetical protein [Neglectibacter sp. 59]